MKRAQTIAEAAGSKLLSPALNLWSRDIALEELYVPRPGERALGDGRPTLPLSRRIRDKLLLSDGPIKILLTGQIGSGKSSELRCLYLDESIQTHFEQIIIRLIERVDERHADIRQLLVAIAACIAEHVREHEFHKRERWKLDESLGKDLRNWIDHLAQAFDVPAPNPGEDPVVQFGAVFAKFSAKLRSEESYRKMIRDDRRFGVLELVKICNHLILIVERAADRPVLLVVDDGDKIDQLQVARELFVEQFPQIARLYCRMILTYPYALNFVAGVHQVGGAEPFVLENVKVVDRGRETEPRPAAVEFFRELLSCRVALELVDDAALVEAVRYCAGIPREFIRIMRGAFEFAYNYEYERVSKDAVDFVIAELRVHMSRQTQSDSTRRALRRVHETKRLPDDFDRSLLQALLVVEYSNDLPWYDVHPILRDHVRTFTNDTSRA
jgi:hypothetical protein